ncbi:MAG: RNA polymerase sigma factor [Candidatus Hydrogenedentes bacterium]|nr:RNA polymerase sigma factor [Candidatus Hydrogenedentota bacterium]
MKDTNHIRDEILVLRAQAGPDGFDALVARWQPALWRHAHRMTRDPQQAWDIVQEVWCAIVRRLDRLEDPAAFPRWAFQIVTNKYRDWLRKEGRRRRAMASYERQPEPAGPPPPACAGVEGALARLGRESRQLVALCYEEEFSVREIAEILGIKEGTVKSRLHRARLELRGYLEEPSHEE